MDLGDTDMMELHNMLRRSTHHPTTAQHTNVVPVMLVISESQFTFSMEVCFDPIIYSSVIYATIWSFSLVNSQLIFTLSSWTSHSVHPRPPLPTLKKGRGIDPPKNCKKGVDRKFWVKSRWLARRGGSF